MSTTTSSPSEALLHEVVMLELGIVIGIAAFIVVVAIALYVSSHRGGTWRAIAVLWALGILPALLCGFYFPPLLYQYGLTMLATIGCRLFKAPVPVFVGLTILAIPGALGVAYASTAGDRARMAALRAEHPIEDLDERLDAESPPPVIEPTESMESHIAALETALEEPYRSRVGALRRIHEDRVDLFVTLGGFGVSRMMGMTRARLDPPEWSDVPQPEPADYEPRSQELPTLTVAEEPGRSLHFASLLDFLHLDGMGWIVGHRRAAGFRSHRFRQLPTVEESFEIRQLELVGLLLHPEPVVYESDDLPDLARLDEYTTRPLDAFELAALARLRGDQDLVVAEEGDHTRMLGSLRATDQCLKCHVANRGDLLGGFSYVLGPRRVSSPTTSEETTSP